MADHRAANPSGRGVGDDWGMVRVWDHLFGHGVGGWAGRSARFDWGVRLGDTAGKGVDLASRAANLMGERADGIIFGTGVVSSGKFEAAIAVGGGVRVDDGGGIIPSP